MNTNCRQFVKRERLETAPFLRPEGAQGDNAYNALKKDYQSAVSNHPFINKSYYNIIIDSNAVFFDDKGEVVGVLLKGSIPSKVVDLAARVLRRAPAKSTLRNNIFGSVAPLSGIAGYYDYTGSPVELKCRKTSFTCENLLDWSNIYPLMHYVSELYRIAAPVQWSAQNDAIPDLVRIHGTPFSTITINQRFRTAKHIDSGDFDNGFGCLAVLEGEYKGLHLGLPDFNVCFKVSPRDLLVFDTHHFHCNTELERYDGKMESWSRLSCVFYYRAMLGENYCLNEYFRRLHEAKENGDDVEFDKIVRKDNGENFNLPSIVHKKKYVSPFGIATCILDLIMQYQIHKRLDTFVLRDVSIFLDIFGEKPLDTWGLAPRPLEQLLSMFNVLHSGAITKNIVLLAPQQMNSLAKQRNLLSMSNLQDTLPPQLFSLYQEKQMKWLDLLKRDWANQYQSNMTKKFIWANKASMNTSFFEFCDIAREVMLELLEKENNNVLPDEESLFWSCFIISVSYVIFENTDIPQEFITGKKIAVKVKDYLHGGTRYFSDLSEENQRISVLRKERLQATQAAMTGMEKHNMRWLQNDDFDYQTEEAVIQYAAMGVECPENFFSFQYASTAHELISRIRSENIIHIEENNSGANVKSADVKFGENEQDAKKTSLLLLVPDVEKATLTKSFTNHISERIISFSKEKKFLPEINRFITCETVQLWSLVAKKKLKNKHDAGGVDRCQLTLEELVNIIESTEWDSLLSHDGLDMDRKVSVCNFSDDVSVTVKSISSVVNMDDQLAFARQNEKGDSRDNLNNIKQHTTMNQGKKYDAVVMLHAISAMCSRDELIAPLIRIICDNISLSKSVFVVECDLNDSSDSLLMNDISQAFDAVRKDILPFVAALKRASGVIWPTIQSSIGRYSRSMSDLIDIVRKSGVRTHGIYQFKRSPLQTQCVLCSTNDGLYNKL